MTIAELVIRLQENEASRRAFLLDPLGFVHEFDRDLADRCGEQLRALAGQLHDAEDVHVPRISTSIA